MLPPAVFRSQVRVYYEDTDAGGIVYHANYLRFFERARTDWLRAMGAQQRDITTREGLMFVVRDMHVDFRVPARLDDLLDVDVRVERCARASLQLAQLAARNADGTPLVLARVRIAAISAQGRPVALPVWLTERARSADSDAPADGVNAVQSSEPDTSQS